MNKAQKITLAVFTAWPPVYMIIFMGTVFGMTLASAGGDSGGPPDMMMILFALHFFTMLEMLVLLVIYIIHVFKTDTVPEDKKALWAVVLFLGNIIAMPIYWFLYIWREPDKTRHVQEPESEAEDSSP